MEGIGSQIYVWDGGSLEGRELLIRGGGFVSVGETDSLIYASQSVRIGGSSPTFPNDSGTSQLRVGTGGRLTTLGAVAVVGAGELNLFGGTVSAQSVTLQGGGLSGGGRVATSVNVQSNGRISPRNSALRTNSVQFSSGSSFIAQLDGTTAGTQYSQLDVTGSITLTGSQLQVSEGFTSKVGDEFQIIRNDGTDPVNGTFNGLLEGAVVTLDGVSYTISYRGGDGNDVVLTSNGNLPVITFPTVATSNNKPEFQWLTVPSAATYTLRVHAENALHRRSRRTL